MIGIVDYGAGNLRSVANALGHVHADFRVCDAGKDLQTVDKVLLPGVGHFAAAVEHLTRTGLMQALREWRRQEKPILGICLGLQLLFEGSEEAPKAPGLGLLAGRVVQLQARRVPHMGWNEVAVAAACPLADEGDCDYYYFAHSYVAAPAAASLVTGTTNLDGLLIPAIVGNDQLWGVQFHPEKSGAAGLRLLARFARC